MKSGSNKMPVNETRHQPKWRENGEERGCRVFHVPIGLVISRQTTKDGRVFDEKALVTNWQLCRLPIFFNFFNLAC